MQQLLAFFHEELNKAVTTLHKEATAASCEYGYGRAHTVTSELLTASSWFNDQHDVLRHVSLYSDRHRGGAIRHGSMLLTQVQRVRNLVHMHEADIAVYKLLQLSVAAIR